MSVFEEKCEKIEISDNDAANSFMKAESAIDTQSIAGASGDLNRQYSNEVQNFVQKKNVAQG